MQYGKRKWMTPTLLWLSSGQAFHWTADDSCASWLLLRVERAAQLYPCNPNTGRDAVVSFERHKLFMEDVGFQTCFCQRCSSAAYIST